MTDRQAILDQLASQGRSRYWLAKLMAERGVCSTQSVYRYLRGEITPNTKFIQSMLDAVGLKRKATPTIDGRWKSPDGPARS